MRSVVSSWRMPGAVHCDVVFNLRVIQVVKQLEQVLHSLPTLRCYSMLVCDADTAEASHAVTVPCT